MGQHHVNFVEDLPKIRKYLAARITTAAKSDEPIAAIEIGFRLFQRGFLGMRFDLQADHLCDVGHALGDPLLKLPRWSKAYMQAEQHGIFFTLLSGKSKTLRPGADDRTVAGVFGTTLLSIFRDAKANRVLDGLKVRDDCQVEIMEFDWMWRWPESGLI